MKKKKKYNANCVVCLRFVVVIVVAVVVVVVIVVAVCFLCPLYTKVHTSAFFLSFGLILLFNYFLMSLFNLFMHSFGTFMTISRVSFSIS